MCGLFGMLGAPSNKTLMQSMLQEAAKRGPNAWGIAWKNTQGLSHYTCSEPLRNHINSISTLLPSDTQAFIGQSRLSTSGTHKDLQNNQPLVIGEKPQQIAIAHNGNIYHYADLISKYGLQLKTQCDSEVLGLLISQQKGSLLERTFTAIHLLPILSPMALLVIDDREMVVVRYGQPLYQTEQNNTIFFCSRAINEKSKLLPDHFTWSWSLLEKCLIESKEIY